MMLLISLALVSLRHMARQLFGSDVLPFLCKHLARASCHLSGSVFPSNTLHRIFKSILFDSIDITLYASSVLILLELFHNWLS